MADKKMTDERVLKVERIGLNALARLALGRELFLSGQSERALVELREAVRINPELELGHFTCGVIYGMRGEYDEGKKALEDALLIRKDFAVAWIALGYIEMQKGDLPAALEATSRGIEHDPLNSRAHAQRGDILRTMDRLDEAAEAYREVVRLAPAQSVVRYKLADVLLRLGRETDAIDAAIATQRINPVDPRSRIQIGDLLAGEGRVEEAITEYKAAAQLQATLSSPSSVPLRKWGMLLVQEGRLMEAIPLLKGSVGINPKDIDALLALGRVFIQLDRPGVAIEFIEAAIAQDPRFQDSHELLQQARDLEGSDSAGRTGLEELLGDGGEPPIPGLEESSE